MTIAERVKAFFDTVEAVWDAVPGALKVFIYATLSYIAAQWIEGSIDWRTVAYAVVINLGLYQAPRTLGTTVKKML